MKQQLNFKERLLTRRKGLVDTSPENNGYFAYLSKENMRWVLPVDSRLRREGIKVFRPQSLKGKAIKKFISLGLLPGKPLPAACDELGSLGAKISSEMGISDLALAVSLGTEGAYQKYTVRVMAPDGSAMAYAKLADTDLAISRLEIEHKAFQVLNSYPELNGMVPSLISYFKWDGTQVLLMNAGLETSSSHKLTPAHFDFLSNLFKASCQESKLFQGDMWGKITQRTKLARAKGERAWSARVGKCFEVLKQRWNGLIVPLSIAHGDFVPWNISGDHRGLYVFDWEGIIFGATPLYDAFHFEAIQKALKNRPYRPDKAFFQGQLSKLWPGNKIEINELYLAYLLDISLFYLEARIKAPKVGDGRVLEWLGRRIDEWMENDAA
ncbi:MAG: hypothetical protein IH995_08600 [Proteobacteria bacterium]|nr:hypothetical protein [Pseudomonadota bacterium]